MTKHELINEVAKQQEISKVEAEKWVDATFEAFKEGLKNDGRVSIYNILTAEIKGTPARSGNLNGKEWSKPASKRIKTTYSKNFEAEVLGE